MSLTIRRLEFRDFRNYPHYVLDDIGPVTVFVGPNAIGKTNIVEGIQLVTALHSFRHHPLAYLVREGCARGRIEIRAADEVRTCDISLDVEPGRRQYQMNGKNKAAQHLRGLIPSVAFTPDDLNLVKGPNSHRRNAVDALGCQVSKNYGAVKKDFDTILKQKNALLKEGASRDYLESVNEVFSTCSAQLTCYRQALFKRLIPYMVESYGQFCRGNELLVPVYAPSWMDETECLAPDESVSRDVARECMGRALTVGLAEEISRGRAVVGAHADRLGFLINGKNASQFGSQGQQRSIVLSWKLAEVACIEDMLSQRPLLLLDDVMSELDDVRRRALMEQIEKSTQVFITTTNLMYFDESFGQSFDVVKLGDE